MTFDLSTAPRQAHGALGKCARGVRRDLLRERVRSGMAVVKARGVTFGRRAGFAPTQRRKGALILSKRNEGKSIRLIADELDINTPTVQRVLKLGKALLT